MVHPFDESRVAARLKPATPAWCIEYHASVTSTMDVARVLAENGAPAFSVVVADAQTAGRGRLGRSWVSVPQANLYFTVLLRPSLLTLRRLAMLAPLAVAEAIGETTGLNPAIKWPNDVQIDGRKVSGMLIDAEVRGNDPAHALIGIGINVNLDPALFDELRDAATSLAVQLGRPVDREEILAATLNRLREVLDAVERGEDVQARWKVRLNTIGQTVRVSGAGRVDAGLVEDVTEEGSLVLRRDDGSVIQIAAGEVTLRA